MRTLFIRLSILLGLGLILVLVPMAGQAQENAECPSFVEKALTDLGQNCDALDRNSACYGFNRVDATFAQDVDTSVFSKPADRSGLAALDSIATAPLDVSQEYWGIAVLNVQANIPNTIPGQAVTFFLLGDVQVDNAVVPEDVFQPAETPINVTAAVGANIRSSPSARANVIGSLMAGSTLPADALSVDGNWVRVPFASGPGWVSREVINADGDLDTLPVFSRDSRSPMQAFTFRTAPSGVSCTEAPPSLLVVQGPDNVSVDITANGADIRIGSTIALRVLEGNKIQLIVVSGEAQIGNLVIPAGFTIFAELSEDGKTLIGDWTNFRPLTQEELDELKGLEGLPPNLLHYPIVLPTLEEIQALLAAFSQASSVDGSTEGPAAGQAQCSSFKPTSPLGGLPFGSTMFFWDPAPGATSYRVNLYDEGGALKASFNSNGAATSLQGDTSALGGGFTFSWDVQALVNGEVACTSGRVTMFREAPPPDPQVTPELTPTCNFNCVCEPGLGETLSCGDCSGW